MVKNVSAKGAPNGKSSNLLNTKGLPENETVLWKILAQNAQ
jgi:hypothetical protein